MTLAERLKAIHAGTIGRFDRDWVSPQDAALRIEELEDEIRGVIGEMRHISDEARKGRSWLRVELLADNVRTVLREKLKK